MSLVSSLLGFGLRQVVGEGVENVIEALEQRFRDHGQTLTKALQHANERCWQAFSVALAGNGLLDRVQLLFASGDDKGVREQVRVFLESNAVSFAGTPTDFRQACLEELKRLRKSGLLSSQGFPSAEIARQAAGFRHYTDTQGLIEGARDAVGRVADALRECYPNLAQLLRTPTPAGPPLLAVAFAYFFRREVETDDELAHGLFFDGLRQLSASQAKAFGEVNKALAFLGERFDALFEQLGRIETTVNETRATVEATHGAVFDIQADVQRLTGLHLTNVEEIRSLLVQVQQQLSGLGMLRGEVRPQHSLSIRNEDERRAVKGLLGRLRELPPEVRKQVPSLAYGEGKLQVGVGDFGGARETFNNVAHDAEGPTAKAEAFFGAYRAALEERSWDAALEAIRQAAAHAPQRFAPFPLHRYEPRRVLGAGGFGVAFLCHDANLDEEVVIKTLHTGDLERGLNDVFLEARVLRQLTHPVIIGARDCEYADSAARARPYLVMDYFPGCTLEQWIDQQGPLRPDQLVAVARLLVEGMLAAHARGILHRDLKPANILVCKEGDHWHARIIDFGLALRRQTIETSVAARAAGSTILGQSVAGTLKYAPPEQMGELRGVKPGPYSDVYAFGKTCCYALFKTTEPKSRHWAAIPPELAGMLERSTEQELEHRYTNFEPLLTVLDGLRQAAEDAARRQQETDRRRSEEEARQKQPLGVKQPAATEPLVRQTPGQAPGQIEAFYEDFKRRHGARPRAAQALRAGQDPGAVRSRYGSWLAFVDAKGDLSEGQKVILEEHGDLLKMLETTRMTKSFKMLTLQALLARQALPGALGVKDLAAEFRRLAQGSPALLAEVAVDVNDTDKLCRYLEKNPIAAWAGGKGTGGEAYFAYDGVAFSSTFTVADALKAEFHDLVTEIVEWRLAAYLQETP